MAGSALCLHHGAREVTPQELEGVPAPPPTRTWFPLRHADVLGEVHTRLQASGFRVTRQKLALSRGEARFFGTLDLDSSIVEGVRLAVGVRNSTDKSLPIGFCCGERVFVCDNLAFGSEVVIAKKHTKNGKERFDEGVAEAVGSLSQYREAAAARVTRLRGRPLDPDLANSLILQAYEDGILGARLLPQALSSWRQRALSPFPGDSAWDLFNHLTGVLKARLTQPARHARLTIELQELFDAASTFVSLN